MPDLQIFSHHLEGRDEFRCEVTSARNSERRQKRLLVQCPHPIF